MPASHLIQRPFHDTTDFPRKKAEDVLGGAESWENVDRTAAQCPNETCGAGEAYFYQVQIRSADEPMTTFLKCCECGREWREG